jgi:DNA-binding beta-propeller fold protein YncE
MQKNILYTTYALLGAALLCAVLVLASHYRKPVANAQPEAQGFYKPRGMAFGADGTLYIVDSRNNRIEEHNAQGALIRRVGHQGVRDGELREPCDVAVGKDGTIFVADTFYTLDPQGGLPWGRVEKFGPDAMFAGGWSKASVAPNDFFGPRAIALDSKGFVYLSDTGNNRIVKFDSNGSFMKAWGTAGSGEGQFKEPFGIAFDSKDQLYVVDRLNARVQVFSEEGKFLRQFKADCSDQDQVNREPYIAVDSARNSVWVSNPIKGEVLRFTLQGSPVKTYKAALEGPMNQPTGLAVRASDGMLFVSDGELARIVTVKP